MRKALSLLLLFAACLSLTAQGLEMVELGTYQSGVFDEGAAEITAHDPATQRLFMVNGDTGAIDVLDFSNPKNLTLLFSIDLSELGDGANSVAFKDGVLAAAIEAENSQEAGRIGFFDADGNLLSSVAAGALPDMVTFTPDGSKVLSANEGEPNDDYTVDPEGSVTIVDISGGAANVTDANVTHAGFSAFNDNIDPAVRIFGLNATVAQDLEPEYIAVSSDSSTAWVICQENNALAVVDLNAGEVTSIVPLGYKDHSFPGNALDASNRDDAINITNWPVLGMYQPDAIASYNVGGQDFIVSANEGDARDYDGFSEEERVGGLNLDPTAYPNADELQDNANLGRINSTTATGDTDGDGDIDQIYVYGARSFSIWADDGSLVWDSGDQFETILAELLPNDFNSTNDENDSFDNRSDDKGPEPEGVVIGEIAGQYYAFIGLERIGGIMVYNITDPTAPSFVRYESNRDFSGDAEAGTAGDLAPEGLQFIQPGDSPNGNALLVVANEVSGTVTVYQVEPQRPLSSMVAVTSTTSITNMMKSKVDDYARGEDVGDFPLENIITDTVRTLPELNHNVVVKWLDPLTRDESERGQFYGANNDFIAYMGDGWNADWRSGVVGDSPYFNGSSSAGWIWSNFEYVSNSVPTPTSAPNGQALTLARFLKTKGILTNDVESDIWSQSDVDTFVEWHKKMLGGGWFRVVQAPDGTWSVDRDANNIRYDSTSGTLATITGHLITRPSIDDRGNTLPRNVVPGITGDCSGALTPWGTILTAEENVQGYYGDLETGWTSRNRFVPGQGIDPGGFITFNVNAAAEASLFGRHSDPNQRKDRDNYGFLTEIDPGARPSTFYTSVARGGPGEGHRKIGSMGRARWENAAFAMNSQFELIEGQPVVIYGGDDRRGGRVFKFVSDRVYRSGMSRGQVRRLLDSGYLYVAHFENLNVANGITLFDPENPDGPGIVPTEESRGKGTWIRLSVFNFRQEAPNAPALGPGTTVGAALQDVNWNSIAGFRNNEDVEKVLFTVCNKLGVSEMNRPEDIEYNPNDMSGTPRIYVAFTNHTRSSANNQDGVLDDTTPSRGDSSGSIFVMEEGNAGDPASSESFTYWRVWKGFTPDTADEAATFAAGDPDNLAIGRNGEVFFGTDGNPGSTGLTRADAIYYLDTNPRNKAGMPGIENPTYGLAFRFVASPADSEATGPWFTPDGTTMFFNVQHPGERANVLSTWPQDR